MSRKRANLTDLLNNLTFRVIHNKFKMLAETIHEWEGLPDVIEQKHIERYLYEYGMCCYFKNGEGSYMCLPCSPSGKYNVYGEPLSYRVTGFGGFTRVIPADKCVIIENNPLRLPTDDFVMFYVNKITEAERTMDVNVKSCKTPYIIACDDKTVLTFKNIFAQVDGNVPAIYADKGLNLDALQVLNTKPDFLCNDLMDYKKSVENELLTLLGFDNLAVDKKERVNLSEANSNNQLTQSFADLMLDSRKLACERINEMFGEPVTVSRKEVINNVEIDPVQHDESDN